MTTKPTAAERLELLLADMRAEPGERTTGQVSALYRSMGWAPNRSTARNDLKTLVARGLLIERGPQNGRKFVINEATEQRPPIAEGGESAAKALEAAGIPAMAYGRRDGWVLNRVAPDDPLMAHWAHCGPVIADRPAYFAERDEQLPRMAEVLHAASFAVTYLADEVCAVFVHEYPEPHAGLRYAAEKFGNRWGVRDTITGPRVEWADDHGAAVSRAAELSAADFMGDATFFRSEQREDYDVGGGDTGDLTALLGHDGRDQGGPPVFETHGRSHIVIRYADGDVTVVRPVRPGTICDCGREVQPGEDHSMCYPGME